jgi:hypothetical protein
MKQLRDILNTVLPIVLFLIVTILLPVLRRKQKKKILENFRVLRQYIGGDIEKGSSLEMPHFRAKYGGHNTDIFFKSLNKRKGTKLMLFITMKINTSFSVIVNPSSLFGKANIGISNIEKKYTITSSDSNKARSLFMSTGMIQYLNTLQEFVKNGIQLGPDIIILKKRFTSWKDTEPQKMLKYLENLNLIARTIERII